MRYLVISDIHANLEALEATLAAAGPYDRVLVLGDLVGYGADPNAVIERVRALPAATIIRGNHDKVGAGLENVEGFNHLARQAIAWTTGMLTPANRDWLAALPQGPVIVDEGVEICHGTPFDEDVYVFDDLDALRALRASRRPLCLFGHTHVPAVFQLADRSGNGPGGRLQGGDELELLGVPREVSYRLTLERGAKYLVNCGAVGQPRDGDARAAFGFFEPESRTLTMMRTAYDVVAAQAKIVAAGLPEVLAQRLAVGR
ncbi:MAG: metallophosphoesterase family protein [Acidobacteria bacterium]|nr:metallophosphoesterase family protein [Acidobacteriota bacterium]